MFQLPVVRSAHADVSAALGAALQAAAVHTGRSVGEYCAEAMRSEEIVFSSKVKTTARNNSSINSDSTRVYHPNIDHKELYQQLYRRSTALCDALFQNKLLLQIPEVPHV